MKLFDACAYVIIDEDRLLAADRGRDPSIAVTEGKPWKAVEVWLRQAKAKGERVPFVVWDAKRTHRWLGWGLLLDVNVRRIDAKHSQTAFRFQNLRPLGKHTRSDLVLLEQKRQLSGDFIRSYARLETPEFLKEFADDGGPLLSAWLQSSSAVEHAFDLVYGDEEEARREAEGILERALTTVKDMVAGKWGVILTPGRIRVVVGSGLVLQMGYGDFVPEVGVNDSLQFHFKLEEDAEEEGDSERTLTELFDKYERGFRAGVAELGAACCDLASDTDVAQNYLRSTQPELAPFATSSPGARSHADVLWDYLRTRNSRAEPVVQDDPWAGLSDEEREQRLRRFCSTVDEIWIDEDGTMHI